MRAGVVRAAPPPARGRAWWGVALQPVGVVLVLVAHGMVVDPAPRGPEDPMLLLIGALAVAGLVPVVVQGRRVGGLGAVAGRVLGWGLVQSLVGIATALLVRVVAGPEWSNVAIFAAAAGVLAAGVWLVLCVGWVGVRLLIVAAGGVRDDAGRPSALAVVVGGTGLALLSSLVLAVAASVADGPGGGRGGVALAEVLLWSSQVDGPAAWAARLGGAGVLLGLLGVVGGVAGLLLHGRARAGAEPEGSAGGGDGAPAGRP